MAPSVSIWKGLMWQLNGETNLYRIWMGGSSVETKYMFTINGTFVFFKPSNTAQVNTAQSANLEGCFAVISHNSFSFRVCPCVQMHPNKRRQVYGTLNIEGYYNHKQASNKLLTRMLILRSCTMPAVSNIQPVGQNWPNRGFSPGCWMNV